MRVIAGEFRSRKLKSLPGLDVRPTPDRLREALFNVLAPRIEGTVFVDAYAGTGAVGIEALSRGAARAVFVENRHEAIAVIRQNLASLGLEGRAEIVKGRAHTYLAGRAIEGCIVFLDPPYNREDEYENAMRSLAAASPSLVIVQHSSKLKLADSYGPLRRYRVLRQGDNSLSFYKQ